jgi:integral membrane protein
VVLGAQRESADFLLVLLRAVREPAGPPPTIEAVSRTLVRLFFVVATLEALSWLGLLSGMYVKYFTAAGDLGVKIFGPVHGGVFVAYVLLTLLVARLLGWSAWTTLLALACSIPPFATLAFEWWAVRTGRLRWPARAGAPQPAAVAG